jgi:hypothetical protein
MKHFHKILTIALGVALLSMYIYYNSRMQEMQRKVNGLENRIIKVQDEYETQIALLKAGLAEDNNDDLLKISPSPKPKFSVRISKSRKAILSEMKKQLHLSDEQFKKAEECVSVYQQERQAIFGSLKKGDDLEIGSFEYLSRLKKASDEVNRKLRSILRDDQYQLMVKKNYDLKLGIRMPEKIFSGRESNKQALQ